MSTTVHTTMQRIAPGQARHDADDDDGWPIPEFRAGGAQIFYRNFVVERPNCAKIAPNFA